MVFLRQIALVLLARLRLVIIIHGFYSDLKGNPVSPQYEAYDSLHFSPQEISGIASDGIGNPDYTGFLGTPDNKYYKFTPGTGKN